MPMSVRRNLERLLSRGGTIVAVATTMLPTDGDIHFDFSLAVGLRLVVIRHAMVFRLPRKTRRRRVGRKQNRRNQTQKDSMAFLIHY